MRASTELRNKLCKKITNQLDLLHNLQKSWIFHAKEKMQEVTSHEDALWANTTSSTSHTRITFPISPVQLSESEKM